MAVKLLFVCLGNICRSPSAEGIMNHFIAQAGLDGQIVCDSAGTSGYHIGEPPDPRMTAAARRQGISLSGRSRRVEPADFEQFDLILAMDRDNYRTLLERDRTGRYHPKIRLMCDFCERTSEAGRSPQTEVPDPYYGGPDGFDRVIDLLRDACSGLLAHVRENPIGVSR
ncbi:low molecular weight protein-tyrosine-phosphatase [Altericista sp. CCNU0014]|uniref:low molecular weight protein-tyrosine-phosphatase n=1 Tax=Altericista sp. CCNU0014 TaxID=3082949 RepID=UPI00384B26CA